MKKWIIWSVLLIMLCGCTAGTRELSAVTAARLTAGGSAQWPNVKEYGAVGDAAFHHPLGERIDEYGFRAGHYSKLVTAEYHIPYTGVEESSAVYTVIADKDSLYGRRIRLSKVNPGRESYTPEKGDAVVAYTAADPEASVPATDDSAAFEAAIVAGDGCLTLPEGDYLVSQLTAAKIKDIQGPGKIWLKEWAGGTTYYLETGASSVPLSYKNYGWIDESHFHDSAWRDMHWVTCLPQVYGWTESGNFSGNISPHMEFDFHKTRDNLNIWLTIQPAVPEEEFPDSITVCIADMSANYTIKGSKRWQKASGSGVGGGFFDLSWNGTSVDIPESAWKIRRDRVEITLKKEDLFHKNEDGATDKWGMHCWSLDNASIYGRRVEFVCNTARVWVKEESAAGVLMCDIGGDMRTTWENRNVKEGFIQEACDSGTQLLTQNARRFYAYTVTDSKYDRYLPFPD